MKAALILAGGKARRFHGKRKAFLILDGKPLLQRVITLVEPCVDEIYLSGEGDLAQFGYPVVEDNLHGLGPLAGIHAGFSVITSEYTFVTGCDMPFIHQELIQYLFKRAEGYSCCLPKQNDFIEPLCCVYKTEDVRSCFNTVIRRGMRRIWDLIQCLPRPNYVSFEEIKTVDPYLESFRNINTLKDLHHAEKMLRERRP